MKHIVLLIAASFIYVGSLYSQGIDSLPSDPCYYSSARNKVTIYPVPATSTVTIDLRDCDAVDNTVTIFSSDGKRMLTYFSPYSVITIPVNRFAKGLYYVRIHNAKESITGNFVIM